MDKKMIALEVFYVFQERGIQPGSFGTALIKAIAAADASNRAKLATVYPEYVEVVNSITNGPAEAYDEIEKLAFGDW